MSNGVGQCGACGGIYDDEDPHVACPADSPACPACAAAYARGRDEARAEYQATYAENMPRIAHREHRRGFIEGQAAPAGTPPPAELPVPPR